MILGIGTDIVRIERMEAALSRHGARFAIRLLARSELDDFMRAARPAAFLAKRFAAKEALVKALGTGFRDGIRPRHVVVHRDDLGKPELRLAGAARSRADHMGVRHIHLSLTDEREYAVAFVVVEGGDLGKATVRSP